MTLSLSESISEEVPRNIIHLTQILILRHKIYQSIRNFFINRDYIEVETPIMVTSFGIDTHIDAFCVEDNMYLAPSPELQMKRLLGMGMDRIFQFTRAFRKDEKGKLHNTEFSLLEWYHTNEDYLFLMKETEALIREVVQVAKESNFDHLRLPLGKFPQYSVDELFMIHAGWIPSQNWAEDRFFFDLVDKVEPHLASEPVVIIYDFPAPLASLARLKPNTPHLCERFELYLDGLEVANAFSELTDPIEQKRRFISVMEQRKKMGKRSYPIDQKFLRILEDNLLPPCAGIALGLDRLMMAITGQHNIEMVMAFPMPLL